MRHRSRSGYRRGGAALGRISPEGGVPGKIPGTGEELGGFAHEGSFPELRRRLLEPVDPVLQPGELTGPSCAPDAAGAVSGCCVPAESRPRWCPRRRETGPAHQAHLSRPNLGSCRISSRPYPTPAVAEGKRRSEDLTVNHRPQPTMQPVTRQMTGEHLPRRRGTWCSTQLNTIRAHGIPLTVVRVSPGLPPGPAWTLPQGARQAPVPGQVIALATRCPMDARPTRRIGRLHPAGRP